MVYIMRHKAGSGVLAVYDTADAAAPADGPVTDPYNNLGVIAFHSGLNYPAIIPGKTTSGVAVLTYSYDNIAGFGTSSYFSGQIALFAHGMGDVPVVFGKLTGVSYTSIGAINNPTPITGTNIPLTGTVPIGHNSTIGTGTWVALAADATFVYLRYWGCAVNGSPLGPFTLSWTCNVLDATISGTNPFAGDATKPLLELLGTRITAGRRKFDTDNQYLRANAGTNVTVLPQGETIQITGTPTVPSLLSFDNTWGWRYSVNGNVMQAGDAGSSFTSVDTGVGY